MLLLEFIKKNYNIENAKNQPHWNKNTLKAAVTASLPVIQSRRRPGMF